MSSVLIVDDEPQMRQLLRRWLAPAGYDVSEAPDASAALELLTASASDVVLCDVNMPGNDGLWLVARVRERFPAVAIVLATAENEIAGSVTLQPGVVGYLVKPFTGAAVLAAVKRAVKWHLKAMEATQGNASDDAVAQWLRGRGGVPPPSGDRQ